jgi:alkaline phosphatase D
LLPGGGGGDGVYGEGVGVHGERVSTVAFGSCHRLENAHGVWDSINGLGGGSGPDVFVFLGDNVYADTEDMGVMRGKYERLRSLAGVERLFEESVVLGTWDDHDYGANDAGKGYPKKAESQRALLDFLGEPRRSWRRETEGVYDAEVFGPEGERVQIILLDTRYFRDDLVRREGGGPDWTNGVGGRYGARWDRDATMLGEAQWAWLEARLREPADVRLICSSIQVLAEDHGYEKWANLPRERARLFDVIRRTGAEGVVFLSGDRHRAEISRFDDERAMPGSGSGVGYALFDVTSSALNASGGRWLNELNRHRVGNQFFEDNFGVIEIDWEARPVAVEMRVHRSDGREALMHRVVLTELMR